MNRGYLDDLDTYARLLILAKYENALSVLTPSMIKWFGITIIEVTVRNDPYDDPTFIQRLGDIGVEFNLTSSACLYDALDKPKTFRFILHNFKLDPSLRLLSYAIRSNKCIPCILLIERGVCAFPSEAELFISALSHAKRATYALLKSYKMLGKDVTRIIAKLVWGSRANINWE